jgi:uncharacterized SAM-binding protein YcdF (DUF218 family)
VLAVYIFQYGQPDQAASADVIIVLGAGTRPDGKASAATWRRTQHAATLYKRGLAPYILCTGNPTPPSPISEAQACATVLQQAGIPLSAIVMEENSTSTEENAIEARKVMDKHSLKTALLVTDDFHMLRAEMLFHKYGFTVLRSPAQVTTGPMDWWLVVYDSYREVAAVSWYTFKTVLNLPYTSTRF